MNMTDELKALFDDKVYTNDMDDFDKLSINIALIFDVACTIGGFMLAKHAINKYLEPKGLLQNLGAFGLCGAVAGYADLNVTDTLRKSIIKENKKNGRSEVTEE